MTSSKAAELIVAATDRLRAAVEERLDAYGNERDWQKMRAWEMADIAAQEAGVELTQLALDLTRNE